MVVFAFVGRYFNLFPELQDPFTVALVLFIALIQVGSGFMITQGDVEANTVTDQGEQHRQLSLYKGRDTPSQFRHTILIKTRQEPNDVIAIYVSTNSSIV